MLLDRYGSSGGQGGYSNGGAGGLGSGLKTIHWDLSQLPVFEKNFYIEHPAVTARSESVAEEWRRSNSITVNGKGIPKVCQLSCSCFFHFLIFRMSISLSIHLKKLLCQSMC